MKSPPVPAHRHEFRPSPPGSRQGSREEAPAPRRFRCAAWVILAATSVIVLAVVLFAFYIMKISGAHHPNQMTDTSCSNDDDCAEYEQLLQKTLNLSANPCHDFKAFVTSSWLPPAGQTDNQAWKVDWDPAYQFIKSFSKEIRDSGSSTPAYPLMRVAQSYFTNCKDDTTPNGHDTRMLFKQLLRNLSIPWPERPPIGVDPLDAFLNLCIKFQVALWFDVKMIAGNSVRGRKAVSIRPSAQAKFLTNKYKDMRSDAKVQQHLNGLLAYFSYEGDGHKSEERVDTYKVFNITKYFASRLAAVTEEKASVVVRLEDFSRQMDVSPGRIIGLLNKYFHPKDPFVGEDFAVIRGKGMVVAVGNLLHDHDPTLVLSHLGWWMIEVYAPILDRELFVQKYGNRNLGNKIGPLFCTTQVESAFKIMLLANHVRLNFPPSIQADVDQLLNNVRKAATALYYESDLPVSKKLQITENIRGLKINLWPDQRYQSEEEIRRIYAHVNGHQVTTLGFWITTRIATAEHIGTDAYFEEKRLPRSFADAPFSYDDVLNTVTMSMLAAHAPFYYRDHNLPGAKYGGLGVEFAKELILAVCSEPVFIDSQADFHRVFGTTANESSPEIVSDAHASISAWKVAFRAFKGQKASSMKVRGFTSDALFFISACHTQSRLSPGFDCNKELQGEAAFVGAFKCVKGSPMNP